MEKANFIDLVAKYWQQIITFIGLISWGAKLELNQRVHRNQIDELIESTTGNTEEITDLKINTFKKEDAEKLLNEVNKNGKCLARIEGYLSNRRR